MADLTLGEWGLILLSILLLGVGYVAFWTVIVFRAEIWGIARTIFNRYLFFRWHGVEQQPHVLSSEAQRELDELTRMLADLPDTYQREPAKPEPVREPVRSDRTPDDDIIGYLATRKRPGGTAYRFSANQIVTMMGSARNEVLAKINAAAPGRQAPPQPAPDRAPTGPQFPPLSPEEQATREELGLPV